MSAATTVLGAIESQSPVPSNVRRAYLTPIHASDMSVENQVRCTVVYKHMDIAVKTAILPRQRRDETKVYNTTSHGYEEIQFSAEDHERLNTDVAFLLACYTLKLIASSQPLR